ncbi:hypothetical protein [Nostoc sp. UHCC 0252]|uniref:hypothetical protein n=1 Tax=Nostoc sp. UHCC 0252 TaxID=3110241 RepID=UPI002B206DED|nr:hypothetical protein [Nostoc sp. UHCC 0252]MEA5605455.1 hypothetical protein [Nostoc sp. UHCC 0252]
MQMLPVVFLHCKVKSLLEQRNQFQQNNRHQRLRVIQSRMEYCLGHSTCHSSHRFGSELTQECMGFARNRNKSNYYPIGFHHSHPVLESYHLLDRQTLRQ